MRAVVDRTGLVLVAAAGLALGVCRGGRERPKASEAEPPPRAVRTAAVVRAGGADETSAPGVVEARQRAALASRLQAAVVELPFREGDRVSAGVLVARLDDAAPRAALAAAEAAGRAAEADLRRVQALLSRGAATPREADEASARAAGARAVLQSARDGLAYAALRAPFAGVVVARPVHVGDVVAPGMPVLEMEGDGGLEVKATVDGVTAAFVRPGLAVKAVVDGQPLPLPATVRAVSPAGDPTTHRFEVRAGLPVAAGLRSGLFARLLIATFAPDGHLLVPERAVVHRGGLSGVFVVVNGRALLRWVALGEPSAGLVEVRAGVEAGEKVVLDPDGLRDGLPVREER